MAERKIIEIERDLCNGCGLCTAACAEGALALDAENKAVLLKEIYCDGLGACLDVCPTGALKIVEREGADYAPGAAYGHVRETRGTEAARRVHGALEQEAEPSPTLACGCPGGLAREIKRPRAARGVQRPGRTPFASELSQWPIQLDLVSPHAPYFHNADLLVAADCTAFSLGSFHQELLKGKKLVIACPKLDDSKGYVEKLTEILKNNTIYSLTVAVMTVPCCSGLVRMAEQAVAISGAKVTAKTVVIDIDGTLQNAGG
jgi:ferredoxin